jgi:hypothetical protein
MQTPPRCVYWSVCWFFLHEDIRDHDTDQITRRPGPDTRAPPRLPWRSSRQHPVCVPERALRVVDRDRPRTAAAAPRRP